MTIKAGDIYYSLSRYSGSGWSRSGILSIGHKYQVVSGPFEGGRNNYGGPYYHVKQVVEGAPAEAKSKYLRAYTTTDSSTLRLAVDGRSTTIYPEAVEKEVLGGYVRELKRNMTLFHLREVAKNVAERPAIMSKPASFSRQECVGAPQFVKDAHASSVRDALPAGHALRGATDADLSVLLEVLHVMYTRGES